MSKLDETLKRIFTQVALEVKEKFDIDYSIEQIYHVFNGQVETTKLALSKGINIHWTRFGKFVFTRRGEMKSEYNKYVKEITSEEARYSVEEIEKLKKAFVIEKAIEKKQHITNSVKVQNGNTLSVTEILENKQVNPVKVTLFKPLNR